MRYGDVPWVDKPLDADSQELYKARDDRKYVMSKVLEDIDFAIANLPEAKDVYRVTRWTALALNPESSSSKEHSEISWTWRLGGLSSGISKGWRNVYPNIRLCLICPGETAI